jgi:hypothetical protein
MIPLWHVSLHGRCGGISIGTYGYRTLCKRRKGCGVCFFLVEEFLRVRHRGKPLRLVLRNGIIILFFSTTSLHQARLQSIFRHGILQMRCGMRNLSASSLCSGPCRRQHAEAETANRFGVTARAKCWSASDAILIDTLAIRNALKSFACIIGAHSNRHSSETLNLRQIATIRTKCDSPTAAETSRR